MKITSPLIVNSAYCQLRLLSTPLIVTNFASTLNVVLSGFDCIANKLNHSEYSVIVLSEKYVAITMLGLFPNTFSAQWGRTTPTLFVSE